MEADAAGSADHPLETIVNILNRFLEYVTLLLIVCLLSPVLALAQKPSEEEPDSDDTAVQDSRPPFQVIFKNRPSFRFREFASVSLKTKWHLDFQGFDPPVWNPPARETALPETPPTFFLTQARFGLKGNVTSRVNYEVEQIGRAHV